MQILPYYRSDHIDKMDVSSFVSLSIITQQVSNIKIVSNSLSDFYVVYADYRINKNKIY